MLIGLACAPTAACCLSQVAYEVLLNPEDKTDVSLIYANTSEKDIILKDTLDDLARKHDNLHLWYVVDEADSKNFVGSEGYITADVVKQHLPPPLDDNLILVWHPAPTIT